MLEGYKAIAAYLSERMGFEVSVESARRYAGQPTNPLPLKRWRPGRRPRVVADSQALNTWATRQWAAEAPT
jgi:hypothetical protein